ncbi:S4 domain-containing protein [Guyparkeria halophila]|uniref:S4 domain-containing protein n=1 Tax=Guyparkeria halophila TaxID=47960 RepID=A0ABZ0Z1L2_9GAMM|nr:S4 domain-containing protein [Guyparkeria halophila]WQH17317.1 S4 domain-containing protein [Guyparkeria halophila]
MKKTAKKRQPSSSSTTQDSQRLDTWLWAARFFKTRQLASTAIDGGKIELNGQTVTKRGKSVRPGDRLTISKAGLRFVVDVDALNPKRGPASEASQLYHETPESIEKRRLVAEQQRAERELNPHHKPAKQARALLRALRGKSF